MRVSLFSLCLSLWCTPLQRPFKGAACVPETRPEGPNTSLFFREAMRPVAVRLNQRWGAKIAFSIAVFVNALFSVLKLEIAIRNISITEN